MQLVPFIAISVDASQEQPETCGINELEVKDKVRDKLRFDDHLQELTSEILGEDALRNQKDYLKNTPKPDKMSVKQ